MRCGKLVNYHRFYRNLLALLSGSIFFFSFGAGAFEDHACLMQDFSFSIKRPSKMLDFFTPTLTLTKSACELTIEQRWRWAKTWVVDVCRGPIHIKFQQFRHAAWMKKESCHGQERSDKFCQEYRKLMDLIQEEGLLYAAGERDDLQSDHGKTYCLYLLAQSYLGDGKLFSRHASYNPVLSREQGPTMPGMMTPTSAVSSSTSSSSLIATQILPQENATPTASPLATPES